MTFHHTQLPNGLTVLAEANPRAQSTALGFFVRTGSRDEELDVAGVSHFLEHMAFKGDERFSAADVNRILDEVGASYNASTSEELTVFYAAILPEYLEQTFELLAALMRPSLRVEDFDMEKQVILEEIGMYEDMPAFALYEKSMGAHFAGHPLSHSVLGSNASIAALTSDQMRTYHERRYGAANLVLAGSGALDWDEFLALAQRHCGGWQPGVPGRARPVPAAPGGHTWIARPQMHQQHVMQLSPAPAADSDLRFAAELVATIVGDEGAGRLHWELVEPGLCESADLSYNDFDGAGVWGTYLCCTPAATADNLRRIAGLYDRMNAEGPTEEELMQARNKVASRVVLGSERPMGRLMALGGNWIYKHEYRSVEDDLRTLEAITLGDISRLLNEYPLGQQTTVGLGPAGE